MSLLLSQKSEKPSKIIDEIEAFQKMKRLRPIRANFVDAFRWNAVLKRRTKKWGGKFIITMAKKKVNHLFASVLHPSNEKNIAKFMTILKLCERSF